MVDDDAVTVRCACGAVAMRLRGEPIVTLACSCDTCREGSRRIEALPNAAPVREADGSTAYVSYRKDRVSMLTGAELLEDHRLPAHPKTHRVVASCCNAAMFMRFDDARHWTPIYRARFVEPPPLEMRICTSLAPEGTVLANDVPSSPNYPGALMMRLLSSRLAMLFGR